MRWLFAWSLYWAGDIVSRVMGDCGVFLYPVYNRLMIWSDWVQEGEDGPWSDP